MFRRSLLVVVAALGLVLMPTTAMAYDAPGYNTTTSDPTPAPNQPVTIEIKGFNPFEPATLTITGDVDLVTIAGTKSSTKPANSAGAATWQVTFGQPGTYTLTGTNSLGVVVSTQTLTVHDAGVAGASAVAGVSAAGATAQLSKTGFANTWMLVAGLALVLGGAGALVVSKRRKTHTSV